MQVRNSEDSYHGCSCPRYCVFFMVEKSKYIKRFQEIYYQKNRKEISDELALLYFEKLISLVGSVYKPIPKSALREYGK